MGDLLLASIVFLFLFLLIKKTEIHPLFHQTFKFPIFWAFQICLEEYQRQSLIFLLFSLCPTRPLHRHGNHHLFMYSVYTVLRFDSPRIQSMPPSFVFLQSTLFIHNEGIRMFSKWDSFTCHPLSVCLSCLFSACWPHLFSEVNPSECKSEGPSYKTFLFIIVPSCSLRILVIFHLI